jgi:hypothetical protein
MQPVDINKKPVRHHLHLPGGLTTQSMLSHDAPQAVHSTPLNHIGLWVDDLPLAVQWLTSQARQLLYTSFLSSYSCSRVCGLPPVVSAKALRVMTSHSCIRRAVLMRPSAAKAFSSSSFRRQLKSLKLFLEVCAQLSSERLEVRC